MVSMVTPKGVSLVQALTFKQAEGVYHADMTSLEVQCHLCDVPPYHVLLRNTLYSYLPRSKKLVRTATLLAPKN